LIGLGLSKGKRPKSKISAVIKDLLVYFVKEQELIPSYNSVYSPYWLEPVFKN